MHPYNLVYFAHLTSSNYSYNHQKPELSLNRVGQLLGTTLYQYSNHHKEQVNLASVSASGQEEPFLELDLTFLFWGYVKRNVQEPGVPRHKVGLSECIAKVLI